MYWPRSFKGLLDFGYQRRGLEIPTFYIVYFIASIMAGAIVGMTISSLFHSDQVRLEWHLDQITASIIFLVIAHFIIKAKGLGEQYKIIWLLPLVTAALTIYVGHAIALIIPTVLSAMRNRNVVTQNATANQSPKEEKPSEQTQTNSDKSN